MIIFDYAGTLLTIDVHNGLRGMKSVMTYVVKNPRNLTAEQVHDVKNSLYAQVCIPARKIGVEIQKQSFDKLLFEFLNLEFSIGYAELERIYWENSSQVSKTPNIEKLLAYLRENNIRSGVLSNLKYSGSALRERINKNLPDNDFEFILSTCDYIMRKPNPLIFELALRKSGLMADEVWFCGDTIDYDVVGAKNVGIFPVWYKEVTTIESQERSTTQSANTCLNIYNWDELISFLEKVR